ncbi:ComEA family DNA-binding protein [Demequina capsici]|uniref:ComEA family DNA-binding protein n=1 Tax=Demequina capsici TaxID=3075620 RepID=A0AA96J7R7_9MICO|nr:ComEA family DNA-binding protein [Demequina sp. OYTSA14]WNM25467.1 ComEA family DNA-binding protein [Demequina sp. OYTSA14]
MDLPTDRNHDAEDVRERWRDSLAHAAASAYRRASADEMPTEARRVRWRLDARSAVSVALLAAVVAVVGWAVVAGAPGAAAPAATAVPSVSSAPTVQTAQPAQVIVHVAGHVVSPGLVSLAAGDRVADAIDAAGGPLDDADLSAVNLARVAQDGEQILVPAVGEQADSGGGPVRLATATADDLEQLPGIGPVLAARIVQDREENGPFMSVEDLTRVSGIGESLVGQLDGLVVP